MNKLWLLFACLLLVPIFTSADNVSIYIDASAVDCTKLNITAQNLSCEAIDADTWKYTGYSGDTELNINRLFFYITERKNQLVETINGVTNLEKLYTDYEPFYGYSFAHVNTWVQTGDTVARNAWYNVTLSSAGLSYLVSQEGYLDGDGADDFYRGSYDSTNVLEYVSPGEYWINHTNNASIFSFTGTKFGYDVAVGGSNSGYQSRLSGILLWNTSLFSSASYDTTVNANEYTYTSIAFNLTAPNVTITTTGPDTFEFFVDNYTTQFDVGTTYVGFEGINVTNVTLYILNGSNVYLTDFSENPSTGVYNYSVNHTINASGNYSFIGSMCNSLNGCSNDTTVGYFNVTTEKTITFNLLDHLGNLISNARMMITGIFDTYSSSYDDSIQDYVTNNTQTQQINISFWDYNYRHVANSSLYNISANSTEINITMSPNRLVLMFYDESNASATVNGAVVNGNDTLTFTNSTLVVIQTDMEVGYVKSYFNSTDGENWSQYYEYYNTQTTNIFEDITIMNDPDQLVYVVVNDESGSPIKDATISLRWVYVPDDNIWYKQRTIGQRLTDTDGITFFWLKDTGFVTYSVVADGYTPVTGSILPADLTTNTPDTAFEIILEESEYDFEDGTWLGVPSYIYDKTQNLSGVIVNCGALTVGHQTDYANASGESYTLIDESDDVNCNYPFTLISDEDYDSTTEDDIQLGIYINGNLLRTVTIQYQESDDIFDIPDFDFEDIGFVLFLGLIILSAFIGVLNGSSSGGFRVFMYGAIFLSIFNSLFVIPAIICGLILVIQGGIAKLFRD